MAAERLQKILARYGIASRRKAEELIVAGKVRVNGKTVVELGTKADADIDEITVVGKHLRPRRHLLYVALHKPKGCVTTTHDPEGRQTVIDLVRGLPERVYPVGRLDYNSEGLLLLTNDGDFANAVLSAKSEVPKLYEVKVNSYLTTEQEQQFREGVPLFGRRTAPCRLRVLKRATNPWYEVELIEGRTNQIRNMFRYFGLQVEKLRRTRIGFLSLSDLKPTEFRLLAPKEIERFRAALRLEARRA